MRYQPTLTAVLMAALAQPAFADRDDRPRHGGDRACPVVQIEFGTHHRDHYRRSSGYHSTRPSVWYRESYGDRYRTPYRAPYERERYGYSRASGWELFRDGRYRRALDRFGDRAAARPYDGLPKIGYALSAAAVHDDRAAAYAMRRALDRDPRSLRVFNPSRQTARVLRELADRYEYRLHHEPGDRDAALMLVTVRVLLGEPVGGERVLELLGRRDRRLVSAVIRRRGHGY